jgi:hypothetical protein
VRERQRKRGRGKELEVTVSKRENYLWNSFMKSFSHNMWNPYIYMSHKFSENGFMETFHKIHPPKTKKM